LSIARKKSISKASLVLSFQTTHQKISPATSYQNKKYLLRCHLAKRTLVTRCHSRRWRKRRSQMML